MRNARNGLRIAALALALVSVLLFSAAGCAGELDSTLQAAPVELAPGRSLELTFKLPRLHPVALRIACRDADFSGATLLTTVNEHGLLPYHAFGGDTRYDNVKGKPGFHPPIARIEANYVLVADWLKKGTNRLSVTNAGPGRATISSVAIRSVSGHDLPRCENPIYFDFDVWRQGLTLRPGTSWYLDAMLMGIINGSGNYVMNFLGENVLTLTRGAEEARVGWGFGHSHFYSIWHLANNPTLWAKYIDVDGNKETTGRFHSQFAMAQSTPPGADIVLIDPDKFFAVLKPGIDGLLPYSTYYNLTCEQSGPVGQGFGLDGNRWTQYGYDAATWANNYQEAFGRLVRYIHQQNPAAVVLSTHWWGPDIRLLLYDTSPARGHKMSDLIDAMMTHYYSFPYIDFKKDGTPTLDPIHPERQYPGGQFESPDPRNSRRYMGQWVQIPEIAIDFNRYRLGRTEKDLVHGDPAVNCWSDGRPFRYAVGFDGDEGVYNNETCIFDRNYSGPAPYQFLYAMFSYSLLPSAASELKDFLITRTMPLNPDEPQGDDIFTEADVPINRYGAWLEGAAHTHRLKTEDPLYGDLFGYTGFEYGNTGDYIWLAGIKERHHRREPFNACNLVRRTCYAFVTSGQVFPAIVNDPDTNNLIIKTLVVRQDWRDIVGIYAVNFDERPHKLDVSLPVGWAEPALAQVFDHNAADWSDAKEIKLAPKAGAIRYVAEIPAVSPWCVFIYPPTGGTYDGLGGPMIPQPLGPWGEENVAADPVSLRWRTVGTQDRRSGQLTYEVQLAREMLFRPQDIVLVKQTRDPQLELAGLWQPEPNRRYHWRVRAIDGQGNSSGWSRPHSFWYQAVQFANPPKGEAPVLENTVPRAEPLPDLKPFTDADNLAHTGMPFSYGNYWEGAGEAVDGFAQSYWVSNDEERGPIIPGWWAVRFDAEHTINEVKILWADGMLGKDLDVQVWDGAAWKTVKAVRGNAEPQVALKLDRPVNTRAVRLWISAALKEQIAIAELYIH